MGTAKKVDIRPVNIQPNEWPASITLAIALDDESAAELQVPQADRRSEAGNVTYHGEVTGILLEGSHESTLRAFSLAANGVELERSSAGVHAAKSSGNPQVFLSGTVLLPIAGREPRLHVVKVYVTYAAKAKTPSYSVRVRAFPAPKPGERSGHVMGTLVGSFQLKTAA